VLKLWTARAFYRIINRVADVPIPEDVGDFRLVNRRVLDAFLAMPERTRFVRGMFAWVGYRRIGLEYHRDPRHAGRTKYRLGKLVGVAADAITGFSIAPLRLATLLAYASLGAALLVAVYVAVSLALGVTVPGWSSIVLVVAFFSGVQLLTLGILGEYIGRLYVEAKGRPLYLVAERAGEDAGPPAGHAPARRAADG
jgi:dolichol-phosphate mannosyltransferase